MINARRHVGAIALNGCLYAVGGHSGQEHLSSVECFAKDQNFHFLLRRSLILCKLLMKYPVPSALNYSMMIALKFLECH